MVAGGNGLGLGASTGGCCAGAGGVCTAGGSGSGVGAGVATGGGGITTGTWTFGFFWNRHPLEIVISPQTRATRMTVKRDSVP